MQALLTNDGLAYKNIYVNSITVYGTPPIIGNRIRAEAKVSSVDAFGTPNAPVCTAGSTFYSNGTVASPLALFIDSLSTSVFSYDGLGRLGIKYNGTSPLAVKISLESSIAVAPLSGTVFSQCIFQNASRLSGIGTSNIASSQVGTLSNSTFTILTPGDIIYPGFANGTGGALGTWTEVTLQITAI